MGWFFSLSAVCEDAIAATNFAAHFANYAASLSDGQNVICGTAIRQVTDGDWWVMVIPKDHQSNQAWTWPHTDNQSMNEMGHKLYDRLLTASPFIFALVGVEVDEITSTTEIANDIQEDNYVGLVVTTKIWEQANQPKSFIPFNDGYYWHPYEGEK